MLHSGIYTLGGRAGSVLGAAANWTCEAGRASRGAAGWKRSGARSFSNAAVAMAPIKVTGPCSPGFNLSRLFGHHGGSRAVLLEAFFLSCILQDPIAALQSRDISLSLPVKLTV